MSVLKRFRGETTADFLDNAIDLAAYTLQQCKRENIIPKNRTFYGGVDIYKAAMEVVAKASRGNSIHPRDKADARIRRNEMLGAREALEELEVRVAIMHEEQHFPEKVVKEWSRLMEREERLLNGILQSDLERAATLPDRVV